MKEIGEIFREIVRYARDHEADGQAQDGANSLLLNEGRNMFAFEPAFDNHGLTGVEIGRDHHPAGAFLFAGGRL